jgi:hypothetical protein
MAEYCKEIVTSDYIFSSLLNNPAVFRAIALRSSSGKILGVTGVEYTTQSELHTEINILQATPELVAGLREIYTPTPKKSTEVLAAEKSCITCKEIIAAVQARKPVDFSLTKGAMDCLEVKYYYKKIADMYQIDNAFVLVERVTRGEPRILGVVGLAESGLAGMDVKESTYTDSLRLHFSSQAKRRIFVTLNDLHNLPANLSAERLERGRISVGGMNAKSVEEPSLYDAIRAALRRNAFPTRATAVAVRYDSLAQQIFEFRDVECVK